MYLFNRGVWLTAQHRKVRHVRPGVSVIRVDLKRGRELGIRLGPAPFICQQVAKDETAAGIVRVELHGFFSHGNGHKPIGYFWLAPLRPGLPEMKCQKPVRLGIVRIESDRPLQQNARFAPRRRRNPE